MAVVSYDAGTDRLLLTYGGVKLEFKRVAGT